VTGRARGGAWQPPTPTTCSPTGVLPSTDMSGLMQKYEWVKLPDGRRGEISSLHGGAKYAIVAIEDDKGNVTFETFSVFDLVNAGTKPPKVLRDGSAIVRRWVDISSGHRRRTRPPGAEMLICSTLVRGWEWPHPDVSEEPAFVRVEVEGNVNVGGGEIARWLREDRVIVVTPQWHSVLLTIGPFGSDRYERGWHYKYVEDALEAARAWDGVGDPLGGLTRDEAEEGGARWVQNCFNTGMMPAYGEEACPFCHQEIGEEHEPFCAISEAEPGLKMRNVTLDDVRSLAL
jgi:hypothetical protein